MSIHPLEQQVAGHQRDLRAAARRRALARSAHRSRRTAGLLRTATSRLPSAAAARLATPGPASPLGDCG